MVSCMQSRNIVGKLSGKFEIFQSDQGWEVTLDTDELIIHSIEDEREYAFSRFFDVIKKVKYD